jgi:hypothetical protein
MRHTALRVIAALTWATGGLLSMAPRVALAVEPPDLKIEHVGFWAPNDDRGIQFRVTNVGGSRASAGKAHIQTLSPLAGNVAEPPYPALDAGKSFTFKYELAAPCNGHVVRAGVSATADGEKEYDNNFFQGPVCAAKPGSEPKPQGPVTRLPDEGILTVPRDDLVVAPSKPDVCRTMDVPNCPGEWTITLEPSATERYFDDRYRENEFTKSCGLPSPFKEYVVEDSTDGVTPIVGWYQQEVVAEGPFGIEDRQCAYVAEAQTRVNFDHSLFELRPTPPRIIKAELSFDEGVSVKRDTDSSPRPGDRCVTTVDIATQEFSDNLAAGESYRKVPTEEPRQVDVGTAFQQQILNQRPRLGFLLRGAFALDQLEGEGQSSCISELENVRLRVTYVI